MKNELRHAFRAAFARRTVAVAVMLVTALSIGGLTALAAVIKRTLLDPLPFHQPEQLVRIGVWDARRSTIGASPERQLPPGRPISRASRSRPTARSVQPWLAVRRATRIDVVSLLRAN